jgi:hypothetical protein
MDIQPRPFECGGWEVKFQDAATWCFLGSPTLVRLPSGPLLAAHDYFGPHSPHSHDGEEFLSSVYRSTDDGLTWQTVTHIAGAFWSNLFVHRGDVYLLGVSQHYGSIVIRRSEDGGNTWTEPLDAETGLLFPGGPGRTPPCYHCAPMPVVEHGGRLYRAFEDNDPLNWPKGFQSVVISCDAGADLLDAGSWRMSERLAFDPRWARGWDGEQGPGWLEGNVVLDREGEMWNVLRVHSEPEVDKAAMVRVLDEGRRLEFDPAEGFIDFPGGMTKFTIRRDPATGVYLTLSNNNTDPAFPRQRNVLSLHASDDLRHWRHVKTLMEDLSGLEWTESVRQVGFQYVDWHLDGEDIIYLVRTAYRGAHNFHDANRMVFARIETFRASL